MAWASVHPPTFFFNGCLTMAIWDEFGDVLGIDGALLGGAIGISIIVFIVILFSIFKVSSQVTMLSVIAIVALLVVIGLFGSWVIVILAVIGGIMVWREISGGEPEA